MAAAVSGSTPSTRSCASTCPAATGSSPCSAAPDAAGCRPGPLLCLRRKRITTPTLDGLVETGMFSERMARQAEVLTRGGAGQVIGGGMFSGKTTFLSAELDARWPDERTATFERDVLELGLADRWDGNGAPPDVVELYTRSANTEGEGLVDFDELIARSRQWRIDRCILGEIVHGPDAMEMLIASSGATYRSMATIHADDPAIVLDRLALYCAAHPTKPERMADQPDHRPDHRRRLVLRDRRHRRPAAGDGSPRCARSATSPRPGSSPHPRCGPTTRHATASPRPSRGRRVSSTGCDDAGWTST